MKLPLNVVISQQGQYWVAHCREHDLMVSGTNLVELGAKLGKALTSEDLHRLPSVPDDIWSSLTGHPR